MDKRGVALVGHAELEVPAAAGDWFGHPRGLTILFLTATWELFAYYGMRSILVYYMVRQLLLGQERASLTYGLYTAFAYFTPLFGGLISDRWLGRHRSVILGGAIMALGLFMMAFAALFYIALVTIVIGYGLFLTTLPSQIVGLYAAQDPRRRSAYNVWYVGVNLGALLAPLVCGAVGEAYGWNRGFPLAGIGMLLGLSIYVSGRRYLPPDTRGVSANAPMPQDTRPTPKPEPRRGARRELMLRFTLLGGIAGVVVLFRATYEQVGNTLPLWIETTHRSAAGFTIPMAWFQSLSPLLAVLITPFFSTYWLRLGREGREPASIAKMSLGAAITALAFLMLAAVAAWSGARGMHPSGLWVVLFFGVMSLGEVHMLPTGLGLFGRLSPKGFEATALAFWYFANFFGNLAAGLLGTRWSHLSPAAFFTLAAAVAGSSAALLMLFKQPTHRAAAEP